MNVSGGDGGGGVGGDDVYRGKTKSALVSVSDSYSEDEIISVCDSGPSSSPTYTITDYLSTGYCPKKKCIRFCPEKDILL